MTPAPRFDHLVRMTDGRGTFEHALYDLPRPEHGYCTDDMARILVVANRQPDPSSDVHHLVELSLRFLSAAQARDGSYRNRMDRHGRFLDHPTLDDCWGRSLWGLGTAAAHSDLDEVRRSATVQFGVAARRRSPHVRAMAFATLGAAELLAVAPDHHEALRLLTDAADGMAAPSDDVTWPWPEARLRYANAVLPEAMIAAGTVLDRQRLVTDGLELLAWLCDRERVDGHLSVTPARGAGVDDHPPAFDQQPIEVGTLADACARAATVDRDRRWVDGVADAVAWFEGANDAHRVMWEPMTGAGFDGLEPDGVNRNQGTESTLALLSALQHGRRLVTVGA